MRTIIMCGKVKREGPLMKSATRRSEGVKRAKKSVKAGRGPRAESVSKAHTSSSVERAFKILDVLVATSRPWGLTFTELRESTDIPKSTLSYLLRTMIKHGYLRYNEKTKAHSLGTPFIPMGEKVKLRLQGEVPERECREVLNKIVEQLKLGAHLAVLDSGYAVYLWRIEAPGFFTAKISSGKRQIPHVTAVGKALICCHKEDQVQKLLDMHPISPAAFPRAILDLPALMSELAETRERGYAIDDEEHADGVRCVAAPIYAAPGRVVASVGVSGSLAVLKEERMHEEIGPALRAVADEAAQDSRILNALVRYSSMSSN